MKEEDIKKKFDEVQNILDSLQDSGATCMFIGHEGNHFVISGDPKNIGAQIVFAMMRYPVVRNIIMTCVASFEEIANRFSEGVRNVTMDNQIEVNSGN